MTVLQWNYRRGGHERKSSNFSCGTWMKLNEPEMQQGRFSRQIPPVGGALILPASFLPTLSWTLPVTSSPAFPAESTVEEHTFYSQWPLAPPHPHQTLLLWPRPAHATHPLKAGTLSLIHLKNLRISSLGPFRCPLSVWHLSKQRK